MRAPLQQRSFVGWSLYVSGGLLIWVAHFLLGYVLAALACSQGFAHQQIAGISVVTWITALASLVAAVGCCLLMYRALSAMRRSAGHETTRFLHFIAGAVAALALSGIAATALSGALPLQCGP
jgi:hypothetical protein